MPYVIAEPCINVKDKACVEVCPVDCIYEGDTQLFIHPDECIDCGACEPVCPVKAIFSEDDLPEDKKIWVSINAEKASQLPVLDEKQTPLPTAEGRRAELGY